ncbi:MAG: hypothetical protein P1P77_03460 [Spirochaetaceae bacterium]|nr:hypothetical protein [Spirochaetaceae bacterium]
MKQNSKIKTVLLLVLMTLGSRAFPLGTLEVVDSGDVTTRLYSLDEVRRDFHQAADAIRKRHPSLYSNTAILNDVIQRQYGELHDGMTEMELFDAMTRVINSLGCGIPISKPAKPITNT